MTRKLFEIIQRVVSAGSAPTRPPRPVTPARDVDRRREPRLPCWVDVTLTVLDEPGPARAARVVDCASRGVAVLVDAPVRVGGPVMVEATGGLLLGEACHCVAEGGRYRVGVVLRQALDRASPQAALYATLDVVPSTTPHPETSAPPPGRQAD